MYNVCTTLNTQQYKLVMYSAHAKEPQLNVEQLMVQTEYFKLCQLPMSLQQSLNFELICFERSKHRDVNLIYFRNETKQNLKTLHIIFSNGPIMFDTMRPIKE